jgi:hypothetical protein
LQFNFLSIQFNCANFEINPDGRDKGRSERIVTETQQQATFADTF